MKNAPRPLIHRYINLCIIASVGILLLMSVAIGSTQDVVTSLETLKMPREFTLRYKVSIHFTNSPAQIKELLSANTGGIKLAVKRGQMSSEDANVAIKEITDAIGKGVPPDEFTLTLSCRNDKLHFQQEGGNHPHVVDYDGAKTYAYDLTEKRLYVDPKLTFRNFQGLPLPGVGLPGFPLIKLAARSSTSTYIRGDVYTDHALASGEAVYAPGNLKFILTGKDIIVQSCTAEAKDRPFQKWEFSGPVRFGTIFIASRIVRTNYDLSDSHDLRLPMSLARYTLLSASPVALPEEEFDPTHRLDKNRSTNPKDVRSVQWNDEKKTVAFAYNAGKSLEAQRDDELKSDLRRERNENARKLVPQNRLGMALLVLLIVTGIWWRMRARRSNG